MGLVNMASDFKQAVTMNDISTAILAKAIDTGMDMGQGVVQLLDSAAMERSVNPAIGGNFDMSV
ncbi:MAG: YjfB family protein [Lachnospiraceae bacterium]|nr:YjfB family protein [Lachnospiraceae bacterium]